MVYQYGLSVSSTKEDAYASLDGTAIATTPGHSCAKSTSRWHIDRLSVGKRQSSKEEKEELGIGTSNMGRRGRAYDFSQRCRS